MKRTFAIAAAGLGVLAPASHASHNGDTHGARDFAVGAGENEFFAGALGLASFTLSAHSDPLGAESAGYVTSRGDPDGPGPVAPFTARGEVTCLRVIGNRAAIKWRFEEATGSAEPFEGGGVQSFVEDNGEPREGESPDGASLDPPQPAGAFDATADMCSPPRPVNEQLNQGNVTVHDSTGR